MKRACMFLVGLLLSLSLAVLTLSALIGGSAASSSVMKSMLTSHSSYGETGLPDAEYAGMASMMAKYLAGGNTTFQYTFTNEEGTEVSCFNTREQTHMADCLQLFHLCRGIMLLSAAVTSLCILVLVLGKHWGRGTVGFLTGNGLVLLLCLTLVVWGLADFEGLFVRFHQTFFSNDLWLLNPQTDLLIRLMPTQFFVDWAAIIAGLWLTGLVAATVVAGILCRRQRHP